MPKNLTQIGLILKPQGLNGEIKILPMSSNPEYYTQLRQVHLSPRKPALAPKNPALCSKTQTQASEEKFMQCQVQYIRFRNNFLWCGLEGIDNRDLAAELHHMGLWVLNEELQPLAEEEFFVHDFLGSKVYTADQEYLGKVVNYFDNGSHGVVEVEGVKNFLFPTTKEVMLNFEPVQKRVVIQPLPGMLEL